MRHIRYNEAQEEVSGYDQNAPGSDPLLEQGQCQTQGYKEVTSDYSTSKRLN